MITLDANTLRGFDRASELEWLETNGVGGWASSTVCFANTRRYHGLLVAATETERCVVVAKLDETVNGVSLATNRFPGAIHPRGLDHLVAFRKDLFPEWEIEAGGVRLRKTVVAPRGENTTIVVYEVLDAPAPFEMTLAPFLAGREYHSLLRRTPEPPRVDVQIDVPGACFEAAGDWWCNFIYDREEERGLDAIEDLWTPGRYVVTLKAGDVLPVVLSTERRERDALAMVASERARREALAKTSDSFLRDLTLAADQFPVSVIPSAARNPPPEGMSRSARQDTANTIIAGYHWFTDWGRDTLISLPGLCLATGRFTEARAILGRWARCASRGMIPNRFPDGTTEPSYNAVDATLWLFVAAWRYLRATGDRDFVLRELAPVLRESIAAFDRGTRYNIHTDVDGLLYAGAGGVALTWMDAVVDGVVITPRRGKPVEVNALWVNALEIVAELCGDDGVARRAACARTAFERSFWNDESGCCFDVLGPADPSIRPNQLLALSLPFPLFDDERAESILRVIDAKLLTPVGLRTLAPDDPRYRGRLIGPQRERDEAYHQGTVWPWLLGPYIDAVVRLRGDAGRERARELLGNMRRHLGEAGLGTISEVFDGDAPHHPRGCIAQAWSVAEVLRAAMEDEWRHKAPNASTSG